MRAIHTTRATFEIDNAKLYVPAFTLSANDNIKFLENVKAGFKITISWNKYRSEITQKINLNYWIEPHLEILIDCLYFHLKIVLILRETFFKNITCH